MSDFWHGLVNYKPKKTMKAIIEIELGNSAFGSNDAERLFEMLLYPFQHLLCNCLARQRPTRIMVLNGLKQSQMLLAHR